MHNSSKWAIPEQQPEYLQYMKDNSFKIIRFLLARHIISPLEFVNTGVSLSNDVRDRFVLATLSIGGQPAFVIKCARSAENVKSVRQELKVYRYLAGLSNLKFIAPALVAENFQQGLLVLKWVDNTIHDEMEIPQEEMAFRLGLGIGKLHAATHGSLDEVGSPGRPWILSSLGRHPKWRPPEVDIVLSRINHINREIMVRGLKHALRAWQPDALIHGDLKKEHNLVDLSHNGSSVCLLDWELAGYGDTAWDVASIISDIMFDKQYGNRPLEDSVKIILQAEEVFIFIHNYSRERPADHEFFMRVALYTGARLFQTCIESASAYGVGEESGVDALLTMAADVFRDPRGFSAVLSQGYR